MFTANVLPQHLHKLHKVNANKRSPRKLRKTAAAPRVKCLPATYFQTMVFCRKNSGVCAVEICFFIHQESLKNFHRFAQEDCDFKEV